MWLISYRMTLHGELFYNVCTPLDYIATHCRMKDELERIPIMLLL